MRLAVVVHAQRGVAKLQGLARLDGLAGRHHPGTGRGLVRPALHQTAPEMAFGTLDLLDGVRQSEDGQCVAIRLDERMVAQPVVAMVVTVEHSHHRQAADLADHADRHLADLKRGTGVQHHHTRRGHHEHDIGHHAAVLGRGKSVRGVDHPYPRRKLLCRKVPDGRALHEIAHLLRQQSRLGPEGDRTDGGHARKKMTALHGDRGHQSMAFRPRTPDWGARH